MKTQEKQIRKEGLNYEEMQRLYTLIRFANDEQKTYIKCYVESLIKYF